MVLKSTGFDVPAVVPINFEAVTVVGTGAREILHQSKDRGVE